MTTRLILATAALTLGVMRASSQTIDDGIHLPVDYGTFDPPAAGASYVDPDFGTTIKRLSDARHTPNDAGSGTLAFVTNEYSTMSPFNRDGTRLLLQHQSYFGLYDGEGRFLRNLPFYVAASAEPRWSRHDPGLLYFVWGNQLRTLRVDDGTSSLVHAFTEYGTVRGNGEADICEDGDHLVLAGDGREVFVYEISTDRKGPVFDAGGHAFDSLYITPDDNVTITWLQPGTARYTGIELFDSHMGFLRQVTRAGGHMDVTRDTNGEEVLVWSNSADPMPVCHNGIVKVRLSDGMQTCLASFDWSLSVHVSAPDAGGWAFVETYAPWDPWPRLGDWPAYTGEILQVRLDGSQRRRLAHHRSRPFETYYYTPRVAANRDGTSLVFSSNFGLQARLGLHTTYTDTYRLTVPDIPPPPPLPTPVPTPPSVRREQDDSSVESSGPWYSNGLSAHSQGSAVLAMQAGARVHLTFEGSRVSWIGYRDQWCGLARVILDGVPQAVVDTYASPSRARATLYSSPVLPSGTHTLAIEVLAEAGPSSNGGWVWVDAFDVVP
jgi:hypothetical protein